MSAPDPLAEVFDGTADALLPVAKYLPAHGHPDWRFLAPHPDDPRWHPTEESA